VTATRLHVKGGRTHKCLDNGNAQSSCKNHMAPAQAVEGKPVFVCECARVLVCARVCACLCVCMRECMHISCPLLSSYN
jgi:hypothetical protein